MQYGMAPVMGYQQMQPPSIGSFAPAPLAEAFGLPQPTAYPQMTAVWPSMTVSNATTNSGIPVSELNNFTNDYASYYEENKSQNNEEAQNN